MDDFYELCKGCKGGVTSAFKYNIELFKRLRESGMNINTSLKETIAAQIEQLKNGIKPWDKLRVDNVQRTKKMKLINYLLGTKSPFSEEMEQAIEKFKKNEWFVNCGKLYKCEEFYDYIQEKNIIEVDKILDRVTNYKNFVCLRNLFIEASYREENYILIKSSSVKAGKVTVVKMLETINQRFIRKNSEIDFDNISQRIIMEYNLNINNCRLELYRFFQNLLLEIYFKEIYTELPQFFNNVFDIYINGHAIIGWQGKFETHDICIIDRPTNSIEQSSGKLILF